MVNSEWYNQSQLRDSGVTLQFCDAPAAPSQLETVQSPPSGSFGVCVIAFRILEYLASGTRTCCRFWWGFSELISNPLPGEGAEGVQSVKGKGLAMEFLRIFPELSSSLCFAEFPISNTDGQRVIILCYYTGCPNFDFSFKRGMGLPLWSNSSDGGINLFVNLWLREASFHNWKVQITAQGLLHSLPEESHKKHRQGNKRWLKTCQSKEEAQNLYPWVYLLVPDTVELWRDCLGRMRWRNCLRIATGSNQTDFRGQRHNPKFLSTAWEPHKGDWLGWSARDNRQKIRKWAVFQEWIYYYNEHGRFKVQEGL